MRTIPLAIATAAVAALGTAGPAFAGGGNSGTVQAVTHSSDHPDTTSMSGPCTEPSDNGPVWALDNLSLKLVAVSTGTNTWDVTVTAHGSFSAFADPNTGACASFNGSVDGWYELTVISTTPPDGKNLPSQVAGSESQGQIVADLFGGHPTSVVGGSYSYTYNRVDGGKYYQP